MTDGMMMGMGWWLVAAPVFGAMLLTLMVFGIVWLVRSLMRDTRPSIAAEDTVRQRYAAGEITQQEYRRVRSDLRDDGR